MPIKVILQEQLPSVHLVFRLTAKDTQFMHDRLHQAIEKGKGMDFTIQNTRGSLSLVWSQEKGYEVRIGAFENEWSYMIKCPMIGYSSKWDQLEVYFSAEEAKGKIEKFLRDMGTNGWSHEPGKQYSDFYTKKSEVEPIKALPTEPVQKTLL